MDSVKEELRAPAVWFASVGHGKSAYVDRSSLLELMAAGLING